MEDPTTNYPKPPFQRQSQPFPGRAGKMDPKPDHGETSYKGSGRLAGRKALITGGDSGMGRAAAIANAREGADVAINYLPDEEPDAKEVIALIEKEGRKGVALPGDLRNQAFCEKLVDDAIKALGGLGYSRQRRRPRPDLDAASGQRRRDDGKAGDVRRRHADGASRSAGRAGVHLRPACGQRSEELDRPGLRRRGRRRSAVTNAIFKSDNSKRKTT